MVKQESAYTWGLNLFGKSFPLNMTQTVAPKVENDVLRMEFDGSFYKAPDAPSYLESTLGHPAFPEINSTHRDQFWVHQDTVNSFFTYLSDEYLPFHMDNKNISDTLIQMIPQIKEVCQDQGLCNVSLAAGLADSAAGKQVVSFTQKDGIMIGDGSIMGTVDVMVLNSSVKNATKVISFETAFK